MLGVGWSIHPIPAWRYHSGFHGSRWVLVVADSLVDKNSAWPSVALWFVARAERRKGEDPRVGWSGRKGRLGEGDPSTSQGAGGWFGRYFLYFFLVGRVGWRKESVFFWNGNGGESCHFLVLIFVGKKLEGLKKERKIKLMLKFFLRRL